MEIIYNFKHIFIQIITCWITLCNGKYYNTRLNSSEAPLDIEGILWVREVYVHFPEYWDNV